MNDPQPVCFQCQSAVENPPRFSYLSNGEVCPTCRDRVLDALPPALPGFARDKAFSVVPAWPVGAVLDDLIPGGDGPSVA